jgi:hypothetical protein
MPAPRIQSALVLGAITRDLENGRAPVSSLRGTRIRRSRRAHAWVTRVREADAAELLAPLIAAGVEVRALPSAATTIYANDYSGAEDRHELLSASDPIGPDDLPAAWRSADVIHLGPLHRRDLLPETLASLSGFTGIDLQGLVRSPTRAVARADPAGYLAHVSVAGQRRDCSAARDRSPGHSEASSGWPVLRLAESAGTSRVRWREEIATPQVPRLPVGAGTSSSRLSMPARTSEPAAAARRGERSREHVGSAARPAGASASDSRPIQRSSRRLLASCLAIQVAPQNPPPPVPERFQAEPALGPAEVEGEPRRRRSEPATAPRTALRFAADRWFSPSPGTATGFQERRRAPQAEVRRRRSRRPRRAKSASRSSSASSKS